jgi:hypothetical protein
MEYKLILSGPLTKQFVENAVKDWVRKHPQGIVRGAAPQPLYGPPAPLQQPKSPNNLRRTPPPSQNRPVYGPPLPTTSSSYKEVALSPQIRIRWVSDMGRQQHHTFQYNDRELLFVQQQGLHSRWVRPGYSWESSSHGLLAVSAVQPATTSLSEWEKLKRAMASGIRQLPGQVAATVQQIIDGLLTWQGMLLIVAVAAIFVLGGEVALILMGAFAVYDLLINVLPLLAEFYHKAVAAQTQADTDAAGKLFAQALLRGGLDVIDILFTAGAVRRLVVLGGGHITARAVWVYLAERVELLTARMRQGAGRLQQLMRQAEEAVERQKTALRGLVSFDEFRASVKDFKDPANQQLAQQAYDLYKAGKWKELESLFNKNSLNGGWPPNRGFINVKNSTLKPGSTFDRYGGWTENGVFRDKGTFVSPVNEPFPNRALPDATKDKPYMKYEVVKPIPVKEGKIIPWFNKPGNGTQYELPETIEDLVKAGYIRPKK